MSAFFNVTISFSSNATMEKETHFAAASADGMFGLSLEATYVIALLCFAVCTLITCEFVSKHRIAKMYERNQASMLHLTATTATKRPSTISSIVEDKYAQDHIKDAFSFDVTHSLNYHKEKSQEISADLQQDKLAMNTIDEQPRIIKLENIQSKKRRDTVSEFDVTVTTNQHHHIGDNNDRSRESNENSEESLLKYIRPIAPKPSKLSFFRRNKSAELSKKDNVEMPVLEKEKSSSKSLKKSRFGSKHNKHLSIPLSPYSSPKKLNPSPLKYNISKPTAHRQISGSMSTNSSTSDFVSAHHAANGYYGLNLVNKDKTNGVVVEGSRDASSSSSCYTYTSKSNGKSATKTTLSPSSMCTSMNSRSKSDSLEESNDYEVQLKIIEDIIEDKENHNLSNNKLFDQKILNEALIKNRITMSEMDFKEFETSNMQMIESSKSSGTVIVHDYDEGINQ